MAKPDMSRDKDLAGQTVSKGGYSITYDDNGYATKAVNNDGRVAAASVDAVTGGGGNRESYGGSVYDQQYFSDSELASAAEIRAAAEAGQTSWDDAHSYVESLRAKYGYSGDTDGSKYIPISQDIGGASGGGFSYGSAPQYVSRYQDKIDELTAQILGRAAFSYDPETDPIYQQYKEAYTRDGQRAMQDTLGQVSARTGGLASSYAGSAAQQTYDNYMAALEDKIPELRQLAYSMYQDEGDTQRANLEMLIALDQGDYAKYADLLSQWNTDRSFDYGVYRDGISDSRYDQEWNYQVGRDQIADQRYEDETEWERSQYASETEYNRALAKAQTLAAGGDFSGYKALGYTDQEIAGLKSAYNKAQASVRSGGGSSRGGSSGGSKSGGSSASEDVYAGMYKAGIRSEGDAYAWLLSAGYNTTQAGKLAEYYADWMKNQGGKGSGSGGKTSLDWDQDEGIFTWNGRSYSSVEQLLNEISQAGLTDSELATLKRKFKLFGFDLS
ncbi:hypothetical protein [Flintibacter porci]|uniref:hypothetical protein n=1 Tax=Flintibacter porci TaxID=3342383 RepID=UPI003F8AA993